MSEMLISTIDQAIIWISDPAAYCILISYSWYDAIVHGPHTELGVAGAGRSRRSPYLLIVKSMVLKAVTPMQSGLDPRSCRVLLHIVGSDSGVAVCICWRSGGPVPNYANLSELSMMSNKGIL